MNAISKILILTAGVFILALSGCQQEPEEALQSPAQEISGEEENIAQGTGEELSDAPGDHAVDKPPEKQLSEKLGDAAEDLEERVESHTQDR